jgi:ATP-dependent RNA helicase SUPV3L1/SUV3
MQRKKDENDPDEDPMKPDETPEPGGIVTTLHKVDLPILRAVLPMELPKIKRATLDVPFRTLSDLSVLLPPNTPYADVLDHLHNLVQLPPNTRAGDFEQLVPVAQVLEPYRDQLSLTEIDLFTCCPVNHRDANIVSIFENIVRRYAEEGLVEIESVFGSTRFLSMLDLVEATLATLPPLPPIIGIGRRVLTPPIIVSSIPSLESMHKALVMYIWLSFRLEVAFPERHHAVELKTRVEVVLDNCLARFPGLRNLKTHERGKGKDRVVAKWRKEHVAPNGTKKVPGVGGKGILWVEEAVVQRLRNKRVWQSTGVVPEERVLKERDGRGVPPPGLIEDGTRTTQPAAVAGEGNDVGERAEGEEHFSKKGGYRSWNKEVVRRARLPESDFQRVMDGQRAGGGGGKDGQ